MVCVVQVKEEVADPECRQVAERAFQTLMRVGGEGKVGAPAPAGAEQGAVLKEAIGAKASNIPEAAFEYAVAAMCQLVSRWWHMLEAADPICNYVHATLAFSIAVVLLILLLM